VIRSFRLLVVPIVALGGTGCLASKGDVLLLQNELKATRASAARSDAAHRRETDSLAAAHTAALNELRAAQAVRDSALRQELQQLLLRAQQATDSKLGDLINRSRNLEITTGEKFKSLNDDVSQIRELARQSVRGVTAARAIAEQAAAKPVGPPAGPLTPADSTAHAPAPVAAGPATLLQAGNAFILQGSCRSARRSYEEILRQFPISLEAPEAQYMIGESFVSCPEGGNPAAADSVYSLVTTRYLKSDFAAISLYKRAGMQTKAGKPDLARSLLQRIVCEFPKSTVFRLATDQLGSQTSCK